MTELTLGDLRRRTADLPDETIIRIDAGTLLSGDCVVKYLKGDEDVRRLDYSTNYFYGKNGNNIDPQSIGDYVDGVVKLGL